MTPEAIHEICGLLTWISLMSTILVYHWISLKYGGTDGPNADQSET